MLTTFELTTTVPTPPPVTLSEAIWNVVFPKGSPFPLYNQVCADPLLLLTDNNDVETTGNRVCRVHHDNVQFEREAMEMSRYVNQYDLTDLTSLLGVELMANSPICVRLLTKEDDNTPQTTLPDNLTYLRGNPTWAKYLINRNLTRAGVALLKYAMERAVKPTERAQVILAGFRNPSLGYSGVRKVAYLKPNPLQLENCGVAWLQAYTGGFAPMYYVVTFSLFPEDMPVTSDVGIVDYTALLTKITRVMVESNDALEEQLGARFPLNAAVDGRKKQAGSFSVVIGGRTITPEAGQPLDDAIVYAVNQTRSGGL